MMVDVNRLNLAQFDEESENKFSGLETNVCSLSFYLLKE